MTTISAITRDYLGGVGISPSHPAVKAFLDHVDSIITELNAQGVYAEGIGEISDDYIRGDVDFSALGATSYPEVFDVTGVTGSGTNTITSGKATLTTGTSDNDAESTLSNLAVFGRGSGVRWKAAINNVATAAMSFGFYQGATKYFEVVLDTDVDANLHARLNDGTGAQNIDLGVTPVNATELDIYLYTDSDGTPHVVIDGTEIDISGTITKAIAADLHKSKMEVITRTTAARVLTASWHKYKRTA